MQFSEDSEGFPGQDDQKAIVRLLTPAAQCLTVLNIAASSMYDQTLPVIIDHLAHAVYLPNLEDLCFEAGAARSSDLLVILRRHSKSLKAIHLRRMVLNHGAWENVFLVLVNMKLPKLENLEVLWPFEADIVRAHSGFFWIDFSEAKNIQWPDGPWTEDNAKAYQQFCEDEEPEVDNEDFFHRLRTTISVVFHFISPYQEKGPKRLHWMAANMVVEDW